MKSSGSIRPAFMWTPLTDPLSLTPLTSLVTDSHPKGCAVLKLKKIFLIYDRQKHIRRNLPETETATTCRIHMGRNFGTVNGKSVLLVCTYFSFDR